MQQRILKIVENKKLSEGIYRMRLAGDVSAVTAPGQFINIKLKGFFLRRPISICDLGEDELTIIYKIMGRGTSELSEYEAGEELESVYAASPGSGQFSFEERMGCGFGACMGCSCKTLTGNKRICKEGPVMRKEEILW